MELNKLQLKTTNIRKVSIKYAKKNNRVINLIIKIL